jgi:hypothetical protein
MPSNSDALPYLPAGEAGADRVDDAGDLMAGDDGVGNPGKGARLGEHVAVTNSAGLHANPHLPGCRIRDRPLDK